MFRKILTEAGPTNVITKLVLLDSDFTDDRFNLQEMLNQIAAKTSIAKIIFIGVSAPHIMITLTAFQKHHIEYIGFENINFSNSTENQWISSLLLFSKTLRFLLLFDLTQAAIADLHVILELEPKELILDIFTNIPKDSFKDLDYAKRLKIRVWEKEACYRLHDIQEAIYRQISPLTSIMTSTSSSSSKVATNRKSRKRPALNSTVELQDETNNSSTADILNQLLLTNKAILEGQQLTNNTLAQIRDSLTHLNNNLIHSNNVFYPISNMGTDFPLTPQPPYTDSTTDVTDSTYDQRRNTPY